MRGKVVVMHSSHLFLIKTLYPQRFTAPVITLPHFLCLHFFLPISQLSCFTFTSYPSLNDVDAQQRWLICAHHVGSESSCLRWDCCLKAACFVLHWNTINAAVTDIHLCTSWMKNGSINCSESCKYLHSLAHLSPKLINPWSKLLQSGYLKSIGSMWNLGLNT